MYDWTIFEREHTDPVAYIVRCLVPKRRTETSPSLPFDSTKVILCRNASKKYSSHDFFHILMSHAVWGQTLTPRCCIKGRCLGAKDGSFPPTDAHSHI